MKGASIIFSVWGQKEGYVFVPCKTKDGTWQEEYFNWPKDRNNIKQWIKECQTNHSNVYWCPTLFTQPIRKKEYIEEVPVLWADFDEVDPRTLPPKVKPTLAYETSPNRYQGLWYLDKNYEPIKAERINRNITYFTGADKGGWDLTQVLRIPGLRNFKYKGGPKGKLLWDKERKVKLSKFKFIPDADIEEDVDIDDVEWQDEYEIDLWQIIRPYLTKLSKRTQELLMADEAQVEEEDRSARLWELECRLIEEGLKVDEVVNIIRASPWNKFKGRRDERKRILTEVKKAEAETEKGTTNATTRPDKPKWISFSEFMAKPVKPPGWLIEGWWQDQSHGFIAGEPKTYKSTLVTDICISVASGEPLFGVYPVHREGPVLLIQLENSEDLVRDRIVKILKHRKLTGSAKVVDKHTVDVRFPKDLPIYQYPIEKMFDLTDKDCQADLEAFVAKVRPSLIVMDPLYLILGSTDENSARELRPILNWLLEIKKTYKTAIMVLHHWNKSGTSSRGGQRMLGSQTLHGWVDSSIYCIVKNEEEHEVIIDKEFRGFPKPAKMEIKYQMGEPGDDYYEPIITDNIATNSDQIYEVIEASTSGLTEKEICDLTKRSRSFVRPRLEELMKKNMIECTGRPKVFTVTGGVEVET